MIVVPSGLYLHVHHAWMVGSQKTRLFGSIIVQGLQPNPKHVAPGTARLGPGFGADGTTTVPSEHSVFAPSHLFSLLLPKKESSAPAYPFCLLLPLS